MTRRSRGLNYLRPAGEIEINPEDARRYGLATGDRARLTTRRGAIEARVRVNGRMLEGMVFYPFHYSEQAGQPPRQRRARQCPSGTPAYKGAAARIERLPVQ